MPTSNLTSTQWDAINARAAAGESVARLAREFGRNKAAMYRMLTRRYGYAARSARRATWPTTVTAPTDPVDVGYMAGIFDGEGSLMLRRGKKDRGIWILRVGMTSLPTIEWLHRFGGTFNPRHNKKGLPQYDWMVARQGDLELLLPVLLPHLIVKHARAKQCLADLAAKRPH